MVKVYQRIPAGPVVDREALQIFERQWATYQKFLDEDYGSTNGAYATLHRVLQERFDRPFAFLDLACGDARGSVDALRGTPIVHYHGVDLSSPALEFAAKNLDALPCEVELEHGDFIDAVNNRPEPADVVWFGLSLHHLHREEKLDLMRAIRRMIGTEGLFIVYEPTSLDGEDREHYLDRFERDARSVFEAFSPDELEAVIEHVRTSDLPETMDSWQGLCRDAGFARMELLFTAKLDLWRVLAFSG